MSVSLLVKSRRPVFSITIPNLRELRDRTRSLRIAAGVALVVVADLYLTDHVTPPGAAPGTTGAPSDPHAYPQATELYARLKAQAGNGVLIGHQDTSAYGVGWRGDPDRSDLKDAVGKWPAVYGWDLGGIETGRDANLDGVKFAEIVDYIKQADRRGGINTVSFHQNNPVTGQGTFDSTAAVQAIIPGGGLHAHYISVLDAIADFLSLLVRDDGSAIPLVLRPYHEPNRSWPWWSMHNCTAAQYVALWRMTVDYFRDAHEIHHVLWCFAPQDVWEREKYMDGYPGDSYVDVLGLDFYEIWHHHHVPNMGLGLSVVNQLARERGKVAALTETGVKNIPNITWWTTHLLASLQTDRHSRRTVWALLWRNKDEHNFFAPYRGHPSVSDFKAMLSTKVVKMADNGR